MKVYIGPYINCWRPQHVINLLKHLGVSEETRDKIEESVPKWVYSFCNWLCDLKKRKTKIRIDPYDTWSMDHTLALIILPMLKQLKKTKHSTSLVDDEDVPDELKSTSAPPKENEWDLDDKHHKRWDYVLDEMIFAFEALCEDDWESRFYSGEIDMKFELINPEETDKEKQLWETVKGPNYSFKIDNEGLKAYNERIDNGTKLFGKYYRGLWD